MKAEPRYTFTTQEVNGAVLVSAAFEVRSVGISSEGHANALRNGFVPAGHLTLSFRHDSPVVWRVDRDPGDENDAK